jgi:hypothetical protein
MSGNNRSCINNRRLEIASVVEESQRRYPELPPEILISVGFLETHLGCDIGEGGNWGAPISRYRRHTAGRPIQAAGALMSSYEYCTSHGYTGWGPAIRRFHTGLCAHRRGWGSAEYRMISRRGDYYVRIVLLRASQMVSVVRSLEISTN